MNTSYITSFYFSMNLTGWGPPVSLGAPVRIQTHPQIRPLYPQGGDARQVLRYITLDDHFRCGVGHVSRRSDTIANTLNSTSHTDWMPLTNAVTYTTQRHTSSAQPEEIIVIE